MEFIITSKRIDKKFSDKLNTVANTHSLYIGSLDEYETTEWDCSNIYLCNTCKSVVIFNWNDSILSPYAEINSRVRFIWNISQGRLIDNNFGNCYESCNELVIKGVLL